MNIMLVSVTERTREIGPRMAMGARRRDILRQFLIEAVSPCLAGGLVGVVRGGTIGLGLARFGIRPARLDPGMAVLALLVPALVGIFFGCWPVRRTAELNPIEALRHE